MSKNGIKVEEDKVKAILDWPTPCNPNNIHSFYGLTSFYMQFVFYFAYISTPFTDLIGQNKKWKWGLTEDQTFSFLKTKMTTTPILQPYDPLLSCVIDFDVFDYAIDTILQ